LLLHRRQTSVNFVSLFQNERPMRPQIKSVFFPALSVLLFATVPAKLAARSSVAYHRRAGKSSGKHSGCGESVICDGGWMRVHERVA
jgi:hypothetical protein